MTRVENNSNVELVIIVIASGNGMVLTLSAVKKICAFILKEEVL